jgi:hypothetical protein
MADSDNKSISRHAERSNTSQLQVTVHEFSYSERTKDKVELGPSENKINTDNCSVTL